DELGLVVHRDDDRHPGPDAAFLEHFGVGERLRVGVGERQADVAVRELGQEIGRLPAREELGEKVLVVAAQTWQSRLQRPAIVRQVLLLETDMAVHSYDKWGQTSSLCFRLYALLRLFGRTLSN